MATVELPLCPTDSLPPAPACAAAPTPTSPKQPSPCQPPCLQLVDARRDAAFYKALHQRARQREDRLKAQVALLQAEIRDLYLPIEKWFSRSLGERTA